MRYYIIAGEASGDLHASNLMKGLYSRDPEASVRFRGGELMEKVWMEHEGGSRDKVSGKAFDYKSGAVMGLIDVIRKFRTVLGGMVQCRKDVTLFNPDVVILVDYPGFNLRIARWAHRKGYRVFYYIAPKVWASREGRIRQIRKSIDRTFIVFPFEKAYFEKKGVPFTYCGNPLVDAVDQTLANIRNALDFRKGLGLNSEGRIVALLAGSRMAEVKVMMPLYSETLALMAADCRFTNLQYVIAGAPGRKPEDYGKIIDRNEEDGGRYTVEMGRGITATLVFGHTGELLAHSHCAVINSGTASLEAALVGTPQVVVYKFASRLTTAIAKRLIKVKFISLGNLCLNRLVFKEICQPGFTAADIAEELKQLVENEDYRQEMKAGYEEIRKALGGKGASDAVASAMVNLLNE